MALPRPIRYPSPITGPSVAPATPTTGSQPTPSINLSFPAPASPLLERVVANRAVRSAAPFASEVFWWPRAGPLGIRVVNNLDVPIRVRVFLANARTTNPAGAKSPLEFDVGPGQTESDSVDPTGDSWAPYAWLLIEPFDLPTAGSMDAEMSRLGDL